jgi:integrase
VGEVIRRSKDGRFLGYYLRWYEGGKRRVMASKQSTHAEARRMLASIEGRIARGLTGLETPAAPAPTVARLIDRFLVEYNRPRVKDLAAYRKNARVALRRALPLLGERPADTIKSAEIAKLRDTLGARFSAASVRLTLAFLKTVYSWAGKAELVSCNPCRGVETPIPRSLLEYLSKEEAERLLSYSRANAPALYPMLSMALHCGLRKGELFGLRWRDLDLGNRRLDIMRSGRLAPKGGSPRHLRLPALLVPILADWQKRCPHTAEGLVFPVERRGVVNIGHSKDMLGLFELLSASGCPVLKRPWHAMRHTFASHYIMAGGNILALQKILGHADLKMTLIYAHLAPDFLDGEMDRVRFKTE